MNKRLFFLAVQSRPEGEEVRHETDEMLKDFQPVINEIARTKFTADGGFFVPFRTEVDSYSRYYTLKPMIFKPIPYPQDDMFFHVNTRNEMNFVTPFVYTAQRRECATHRHDSEIPIGHLDPISERIFPAYQSVNIVSDNAPNVTRKYGNLQMLSFGLRVSFRKRYGFWR